MPVLERSELEASPLADLHAIADQIGLEGFRRLRKADLIDAILGAEEPAAAGDQPRQDSPEAQDSPDAQDSPEVPDAPEVRERDGGEGRRPRIRRRRARRGRIEEGEESSPSASASASASPSASASQEPDAPAPEPDGRADEPGDAGDANVARGIVEVLGNGSAFLR